MCVSKTRKLVEQKRGLALVGILLMLTVLGMVAVLMASLGSENQRLARAQTESGIALNAAEAGLAIALEKYIRDSDYQGDVSPQAFGTLGSTYQVTLYSDSNPPPDGTIVPANHTLIVAQGWSEAGSARQVSAMVTEQIETQGHDNALLAGERVFVSGNAQIASVTQSASMLMQKSSSSSSSTAKSQTSVSGTLTLEGMVISFSLLASEGLSLKAAQAPSGAKNNLTLKKSSSSSKAAGTSSEPAMVAASSEPEQSYELKTTAAGTTGSSGQPDAHIAIAGDGPAALTLEAGAVVDGELRIPPGSEESSVVNDTGSFHDGVKVQSPPTIVPVRLPLVPGDLDLNWTSSSSPSSYQSSFNGNELKPGAYGDVVVDGGILELNTADLGSGDKDLYVFRSLTLKNGGRVVLKGAAETNDVTSGLYIDEKFEIADGSLVNETSDPSRMQVYVSDGAPVNLDFDQEAGAAAMMLYAPGSVVNMGEGELMGNIVGKEVNLKDGAVVNYDSSLAGIQPDPWGNGGFYAYKKSYRRR